MKRGGRNVYTETGDVLVEGEKKEPADGCCTLVATVVPYGGTPVVFTIKIILPRARSILSSSPAVEGAVPDEGLC